MPFAASRIKILKTTTQLGRLVKLVVERERKLPRTSPLGTLAATGSAGMKIRFGARSVTGTVVGYRRFASFLSSEKRAEALAPSHFSPAVRQLSLVDVISLFVES
jgi:hypothetical protein